MGEPFGAGDHAVEPVAMQHQKLPAVGGFVDRFVHDLDAGDHAAAIAAEDFVVIAGHIDHARAGIDLAQQAFDHPVVRFGQYQRRLSRQPSTMSPTRRACRSVVGQEIGQHFGLAAARAQMRVGNEDGAVPADRLEWLKRSRAMGTRAVRAALDLHVRGIRALRSLTRPARPSGPPARRAAKSLGAVWHPACLRIATALLHCRNKIL